MNCDLSAFSSLASSPVCVRVIACMSVEQAGGTVQLQTFHSDEDYNEEDMAKIFVKMQH